MAHRVFQEITDWEFPNHIYILSDKKAKCFGYIPKGSKDPIMFEKSFSFDTRYRKFKELKLEIPS